jgi:hypothetical protein
MALTKFNYNSFDVTSAASTALGFNASANGFATISPGSMTLIKTLTASSSSTLSFVNGSSDVVLDSTYPVYLFKFINTVTQQLMMLSYLLMQSDDTSSHSYNITKTTSNFIALHKEDDGETGLQYQTGKDLAQSTSFQVLSEGISNDNDSSVSGELYLFNPSSTTFVKHFIAKSDKSSAYQVNSYVAGYFNTTAALTAIQFKMDSGNIDAGTIKLYGVKDS